MTIFKKIGCFACAVSTLLVTATSCGKENGASALATPAEPVALTRQEQNDAGYVAFKETLDGFAAQFASQAYKNYNGGENFSVSPLSVFSALALATESADGKTKSQLLNALGVSYEQLQEQYSTLYSDLSITQAEQSSNGKKKYWGEVELSNSIWMQQGIDFKQTALNTLASKYYAYSYLADFKKNNAAANKNLTDFIKKKTHGLINKNYELSKDTVFALVNTLYLKDSWLADGDLPTAGDYTFTNADGSTTTKTLLQGCYIPGRAYETDEYSLFYTTTFNGYKLKFILPKDGYALSDIFTAETLSEVHAVKDFSPTDLENEIDYHTRCIFPEFTAEYDNDIRGLLRENFGVQDLFRADSCDFGNLLQEGTKGVYCSALQHTTKLFVDKTGIEGAAVTVLKLKDTVPDRQQLYCDFIVDRAFGFVITSPRDITLFSGVVKAL